MPQPAGRKAGHGPHCRPASSAALASAGSRGGLGDRRGREGNEAPDGDRQERRSQALGIHVLGSFAVVLTQGGMRRPERKRGRPLPAMLAGGMEKSWRFCGSPRRALIYARDRDLPVRRIRAGPRPGRVALARGRVAARAAGLRPARAARREPRSAGLAGRDHREGVGRPRRDGRGGREPHQVRPPGARRRRQVPAIHPHAAPPGLPLRRSRAGRAGGRCSPPCRRRAARLPRPLART